MRLGLQPFFIPRWNGARRPEPIESDETVSRNLDRLLWAAYPPVQAPERLRARLEQSPPARASRWPIVFGRRIALATGATLLAGSLLSILTGHRQDSPDAALAQVRQAMREVPAVHVVTFNGAGERRGEMWFARALGFRGEGWTGGDGANSEQGGHWGVRVDDLRRAYTWRPGKNLVEVEPSEAALPAQAEDLMRQRTGAGLLETLSVERSRALAEQQLAGGRPIGGTVDLTLEQVRREGRSLRLLRAVRRMPVDTGEETWEDLFYIDPQTDRVVETVSRREPAGTALYSRIDYPDPAALDRSLFTFRIPQGAEVKEWAPLEIDPDPKVEACLNNVRTLTWLLAPRREGSGPLSRSRVLQSVIDGSTTVLHHPEMQWCPADKRKGEKGYSSYLLSGHGGSILECLHHGTKVVRGYADGRARVEEQN